MQSIFAPPSPQPVLDDGTLNAQQALLRAPKAGPGIGTPGGGITQAPISQARPLGLPGGAPPPASVPMAGAEQMGQPAPTAAPSTMGAVQPIGYQPPKTSPMGGNLPTPAGPRPVSSFAPSPGLGPRPNPKSGRGPTAPVGPVYGGKQKQAPGQYRF